MHVPDPRPGRDVLIAATAVTRDLIVVTRHTANFEHLGVALVNPWDEQVDARPWTGVPHGNTRSKPRVDRVMTHCHVSKVPLGGLRLASQPGSWSAGSGGDQW